MLYGSTYTQYLEQVTSSRQTEGTQGADEGGLGRQECFGTQWSWLHDLVSVLNTTD